MQVINAQNVNDALPKAINLLLWDGVERSSRNGPVLAYPEPVTTVYRRPDQRVLFSHKRRANPVFHLMESLWMLAGRNDVAFPATFVKTMKAFSDDGERFHGAYGYRWRKWFEHDQLHWVITELKRDPTSRRAVLQMWDGGRDPIMASHSGKDVPCNTSIYFDVRDGKLNMLVSCRSNDAIWGCYGANVVHMSVLQEYVAASVGVPMGVYRQMSNDLHVYLEKFSQSTLIHLAEDCGRWDYYSATMDLAIPLFQGDIRDTDADLSLMFDAFDTLGVHGMINVNYATPLFRDTVAPMLSAWQSNRVEATDRIAAPDWRIAVREWLENKK